MGVPCRGGSDGIVIDLAKTPQARSDAGRRCLAEVAGLIAAAGARTATATRRPLAAAAARCLRAPRGAARIGIADTETVAGLARIIRGLRIPLAIRPHFGFRPAPVE